MNSAARFRLASLASAAGLCATLALAAPVAGAGAATSAAEPPPPSPPEWQTLGLMRVRDMTPFGIARLDLLPAHAVASTPGTFAVEANLSYQNTWVLSENVEEYLQARGVERGEIGPQEIQDILDLPGDAYLVDGELALLDLTLHYRASQHVALYATIPYFSFEEGFLDSTIEGFHETAGFSSAARDAVPRNRFAVVADLPRTAVVIDRAPEDELGDPVIGVRYALDPPGRRYNLIAEAAAKVVVDDSDRLVSTGQNDYGVQLSLQRFFSRHALYLSLAEVWYQGPHRDLSGDRWIPTVVAGWEGKLTRHTNFIVQASASESAVRDTTLDELKQTKVQVTVGVQRILRGHVLRFGITENVGSFDNTPDVGINLSVARIAFGARERRRP